MLYTLSSITADLSGHVEIKSTPETTDGELRRRVNRIATLDGGAVVDDGGYSEADRTIELAWQPTAALDAAVQRLLSVYSRIAVATRSGVFLAAPETYTPGASESTLRLLVIEKLSA